MNTKIKHYPTYDHYSVFTGDVFGERGPIEKREVRGSYDTASPSRSDSVRRAKIKVYDILMMNDFTYFVTLTFDPKIIDRTDPKIVQAEFRKFCRRCKDSDPSFGYICIPEYHKKGGIHLHCLVKGSALPPLVFSHHYTDDPSHKPIFNIPAWSLGFSTAIALDENKEAISRYVTKYVTKDLKKIFGHFYLAGGDIDREVPSDLCDLSFCDLDAPQYRIPNSDLYVKYIEVFREDDTLENHFISQRGALCDNPFI